MSFIDYLGVSTHKNILDKITTLSWPKGIGALIISMFQIYAPEIHIAWALSLLVIFDTVLGLTAAIIKKNVDSTELFRVLVKFMVYSMLLVTSKIMASEIPYLYPYKIVKSFLLMTEALSILENSAKLGIPIPLKLVEVLKQVGDYNQNLPQKKAKKPKKTKSS